MAAITIDDLTIRRGPFAAVRGLSATVEEGMVTGLLGPSGSGKTTVIRAIAGVQRITAGRISVLGEPAGARSLRGRVGYMTQAPAIYDDLSVLENVAYFGAIVGADRPAAARLLAEVGLGGREKSLTRNLSGGQRARVSLACALIGNPALLLLDEPTVGQDPVLREELWSGFRARARRGATVLVSSHVMDEAARCDALLLLRDGALLAAGPPPDILRQANAADMDAAFLTLIRRAEQAGAPA